MAAMSVIYVTFIKDLLSPHLILQRDTDSLLEREISNTPYDEIRVDFSNVRTISPDFAKQYLLSKSRSEKLIKEVNISPDLEEIMDDARESM
jgi:hypothetical protein